MSDPRIAELEASVASLTAQVEDFYDQQERYGSPAELAAMVESMSAQLDDLYQAREDAAA